jgi:hypothetical protein
MQPKPSGPMAERVYYTQKARHLAFPREGPQVCWAISFRGQSTPGPV